MQFTQCLGSFSHQFYLHDKFRYHNPIKLKCIELLLGIISSSGWRTTGWQPDMLCSVSVVIRDNTYLLSSYFLALQIGLRFKTPFAGLVEEY